MSGEAALFAQPADVTLVKGILRPWLASGVYKARDAATGAYIHIADVSSASPDNLAKHFQATVSLNGDRVWYFLSPLHAKAHGGKRKCKARTTSDGTSWWRDEGAAKQVLDPLDGDRLIGHRKTLSFMRKNAGGPDVRLGWIMHEYYVHLHEDGGPGSMDDTAVLAKLYRSKSKRRRDDKNAGGLRASQNPDASGGAAATSNTQNPEGPPLLAAPSASNTQQNPECPNLLPNKTAAAAASASNTQQNPDDEELPRARKKLAAAAGKGAGAPALHHCPRCGYCIGSLQTVVTPLPPAPPGDGEPEPAPSGESCQ